MNFEIAFTIVTLLIASAIVVTGLQTFLHLIRHKRSRLVHPARFQMWRNGKYSAFITNVDEQGVHVVITPNNVKGAVLSLADWNQLVDDNLLAVD